MSTKKSSVDSFSLLSELAAKATLIEKFVESKTFYEKISNNIAKSIILEADAEKQKVYDNEIKQSFINLCAGLAGGLPKEAGSIRSFLDNAKNSLGDIDVTKQNFNRSVEQEKLYAIADTVKNVVDGIKSTTRTVAGAGVSGRQIKSSDIQGNFAVTSKAKGASQIASELGFNPGSFAEELAGLSATEEGKKTLKSLSGRAPNVAAPKEPPKEEETDQNKEKLNFDEFLNNAIESNEEKYSKFKSDFSMYLKDDVGVSALSLKDFKILLDKGLLDKGKAKALVDQFIKNHPDLDPRKQEKTST
jgi:hypothetical protein